MNTKGFPTSPGERWVICNETNKSALQHSNIKNNLATEVLSIDLLLSCKGAIATCSQKRGKTRKTTPFFMLAEDESLLKPKSKVSHFVLGLVYCKPVVHLMSTIITSVSLAPCSSLPSEKQRCSTLREKKCDNPISPHLLHHTAHCLSNQTLPLCFHVYLPIHAWRRWCRDLTDHKTWWYRSGKAFWRYSWSAPGCNLR